MTAIFGALTTGLGLTEDIAAGVVDRFRSLPIARSAVLIGRTAADLFTNFADADRDVADRLRRRIPADRAGLRGRARVRAGARVRVRVLVDQRVRRAIKVRNPETAQSVGFIWVFPLVFASSAFVPINTMPGAVRAFAEVNPVTQVVDAARALTIGTGDALGHDAGDARLARRPAAGVRAARGPRVPPRLSRTAGRGSQCSGRSDTVGMVSSAEDTDAAATPAAQRTAWPRPALCLRHQGAVPGGVPRPSARQRADHALHRRAARGRGARVVEDDPRRAPGHPARPYRRGAAAPDGADRAGRRRGLGNAVHGRAAAGLPHVSVAGDADDAAHGGAVRPRSARASDGRGDARAARRAPDRRARRGGADRRPRHAAAGSSRAPATDPQLDQKRLLAARVRRLHVALGEEAEAGQTRAGKGRPFHAGGRGGVGADLGAAVHVHDRDGVGVREPRAPARSPHADLLRRRGGDGRRGDRRRGAPARPRPRQARDPPRHRCCSCRSRSRSCSSGTWPRSGTPPGSTG